MRTDGIWFKDEAGRSLLLRGANLSGSSKLPTRPDGATYRRDGFFEHRDVSFVGRPFPLEEADEHLGRLRAWGLTFVRLLITWEAIEHAGPGQYDEDLSIFSRDQQHDPADINSGSRALATFARPYARKTAGTPQHMRWELETRTFEFSWIPDPAISAPTEVTVPNAAYPDGYTVELSAGTHRLEPDQLRLLIETGAGTDPVTLRLRPA